MAEDKHLEAQYPEDFSQYEIGETYPLLRAKNSRTNTSAALSLISQARRTIDLFTDDLDPRVLNSNDIAEAVSGFIRTSTKSRFRILVKDPTSAIKQGHCLVELSRRFSSFITIKKVHDDYQSTNFSLLMVDNKAYAHRANATEYHSTIRYSAGYECREHLEFFNRVWDISETASEIRQLYI